MLKMVVFCVMGWASVASLCKILEIRDLDDAQDCYPCKTRSLSFDQETAP